MSSVILLIHRSESARNFIRHVLVQSNYLVLCAASADEALRVLNNEAGDATPDLLLAGCTVIPELLDSPLRRHFPLHRPLPLLVLDDEPGVTLPESLQRTAPEPQSLLLRARQLLHKAPSPEEIIEHEGLRIDPSRQQAWAGHLQLELTPLTFRLMHLLASHPGRLFSRQQLLDRVWNDHGYVEERTVDVHIYRLRGQLARLGLGHLIESVRGSGYRVAAMKPARHPVHTGQLRFAS